MMDGKLVPGRFCGGLLRRRRRCGGVPARRVGVWAVVAAMVVCGAWSGAVLAEPVSPASLTLEEALAHAAAFHPALQAARLERQAEEDAVIQARALADPSLTVQAVSMERRFGVGVSQMLPLGGKRELQGAMASDNAQAAARKVEAREFAVAAGVVSAFSEWVFLRRSRELVSENLSLVRQLEQVALARYRTGETPYADVVRAQVELARVENELRSLEDIQPAAMSRLAVAMGRPADVLLPVPERLLPVAIELGDDEVLAGLKVANPELAAMRHQVTASLRARELAGRNGIPDLMVGVEVMRSGEMKRNGVGAMVGINLPIWRARRAAEVREAGARADAMTAREGEMTIALQAEARMALFRFRDAGRTLELYESRLMPQAEQALAAMQTAYRAGEATFADLVETARLVLEFRLGRERAQADQWQQLAELEMLTGRRLRP